MMCIQQLLSKIKVFKLFLIFKEYSINYIKYFYKKYKI